MTAREVGYWLILRFLNSVQQTARGPLARVTVVMSVDPEIGDLR
jgi:hypothetical protein